MAISRFSFPTLIHFGPGARAMVKDNLKAQGVSRPLVVTDKGVAGLPMFKEILSGLSGAGLKPTPFSGIWGNPVKTQVTEGVKAFREGKCDSIVGVGGGAALDVAKAIALMIHHPGDLFDYEDDKPGARPFDQEIPYWVAIPTTAGTGSEVGRSSVVSDDQTHIKKIIFSPRLLARVVFADPELTFDLPAKITATTGMDALTHLVESYLAKGYHPLCDGIALEGLRLAAGSLVQAVRKPRDVDARGAMMMASMMGAIAFQKGLGLTHSCAHSLSTVADLHHGLANGIMIDHALKFNIPTVPERFTTMAVTIGLKNTSPEGFIQWLTGLKQEIGIPSKLTEVGLRVNQIDRLSDLAIQDACHQSNPRPCTREDFYRIFGETL